MQQVNKTWLIEPVLKEELIIGRTYSVSFS